MAYSGGEGGNRNKSGAVVEVELCEEAKEEEGNNPQEEVVDILHVRHHGIRNAKARQVGYT